MAAPYGKRPGGDTAPRRAMVSAEPADLGGLPAPHALRDRPTPLEFALSAPRGLSLVAHEARCTPALLRAGIDPRAAIAALPIRYVAGGSVLHSVRPRGDDGPTRPRLSRLSRLGRRPGPRRPRGI